MRIKVAIIISLIVGGIVLTANRLINHRILSPVQIENVVTTYVGCHDKHVAFNYSRCHIDVGSLKVIDNAHTSLEWPDIGTQLFVLVGVIATTRVINKKDKVN